MKRSKAKDVYIFKCIRCNKIRNKTKEEYENESIKYHDICKECLKGFDNNGGN